MAEHALNSEQSAAETERGSAAQLRATTAPRGPARVRGGGGATKTWKQHIVRQLKYRDQRQHAMFQDLIYICTEKYTFCAFKSPVCSGYV